MTCEDNTPAENLRIIRESRHSRFPVVKGDPDKPVGILIVKDLWDALLAEQSEPWIDLSTYSRKPIIVPETIKTARVFDIIKTLKPSDR